MNKVSLVGRLTKDPELRVNEKGNSMVTLSIAVNRTFKNQDGEYDADFINCQAYNQRAELIAKHFKKGDRIGASGRIQTGSYDAQDGTKRYTTNVVIEDIDFIQDKHEAKEEQPQETTDPFEDFANDVALTDEDLPF